MTRHAFARLSGALCLFLAAPHLHAAAVSGRVLDPAGAPVAGAKVVWEAYRSDEEILVDETRGAVPVRLGETATDAGGRFRVTLDKPGLEVSIRVLPGSLPSALLQGPFDSTEDLALEDIQLPSASNVAGRVTDEAGKAVGGAIVRVSAEFRFEAEDGVGFYAEATSGGDGVFALANAPADAMALTARAPGFVPASQRRFQQRSSEKVTLRSGGTVRGTVLDPAGKPAEGAVVSVGSSATKTDGSGAFRLAGILPGARSVEALWKDDFAARKDTVRLRKGETVEVPLRLARAAAVTGTVVDEKSRRPIGGAKVSASASSGPFAFRPDEPARRTRTDGKGRFRLPGLAPRRYSVRAAKSDYLPATIPGVVASISSPGSVSIALQKAATIAGKVVDEKGKGVAGARVRLARDTGVRAMLRGGPRALLGSRPEARTGPDGGFRLAGLAPEKNLTIEAARSGYVPAARHGMTLRAGETIKDVSLVLKQGLEAKGRVVDASGQPIAGAEVRLSRPEAGGARMMIQLAGGQRERPDATTVADGSFRVAGLEAGEYALGVTREGYAGKRVPLVTVQPEGLNEWPPIVLSGGVAIAGTVRNAKGEPVAGADVFSFGEGSGAREASSDPEGKFRLEGLSSERPVMVNVWAEGHGMFSRRVTPPVEDLAVVLKVAGTIRGRVEDAATQRPVSDFTAGYAEPRGGFPGGLRMLRAGGTPSERVFQSPDGSFELSDVPAGKWNVTASAPGYRPAEIAGIDVGEGETKEGVVLSLKKGGVVTGRVLDPRRGTGVPNSSVSWSEGSDTSGMGAAAMAIARLSGDASSSATDADGRFRLEGLPAGKITLTAEHPEYLETSKQIELEDDANVDLTLSVGGSVSGTVVGKDRRSPIAGAQVLLDEQGSTFGMGSESTRADGSGSFLFEHVKSGRYRVSARSSAGSTVSQEIVLADSQRLDGVLLELTSGATVRGTVSGLPASRLAGVRVFGSSRDFQDSAVTDDQGRFVLRDVPAGLLRLNAIADIASMRSTSKNLEVPEGAPEVPVEIVFEGGSRLSGRVTRGEKPIAGVYVSAVPDPPTSGIGRASDQTDEDGRYAIETLADGSYQVSLSGQGVNYRRRFAVSGDTDGDIALPEVSISGVVSESGSREPIEGASIEFEKPNESGGGVTFKSAVTDSRGFYSLADVDPGSYSLTARKDGYQLKTQTVAVSASPVELDLSLARGEGLAVKAVDGLTGLPLSSLIVLAYSAAGTAAYSGSVSLDSEGEGEIPSLAPGSYSLYVYSAGYATRSFPSVQVPSGTLALALTPGGRVEIRSEVPVTGRLLDATGSTYLLFPFRRDGRVNVPAPVAAWERVAPGSYRLIAAGASGDRSYAFTVVEGRTTTIDLR